jgi:hypothetical protein
MLLTAPPSDIVDLVHQSTAMSITDFHYSFIWLARYDTVILDVHIAVLCIRKRFPLFGRFTLPIPGTIFPIHVHLCANPAGFCSWTGSPFPGVRYYLPGFTFFWIAWTGESFFFVPSASESLLALHNPSHPCSCWFHRFGSHVCLDLGTDFFLLYHLPPSLPS